MQAAYTLRNQGQDASSSSEDYSLFEGACITQELSEAAAGLSALVLLGYGAAGARKVSIVC
jgi:hypothetical protein